ncbi:MAG: FtsQ-type POTRA domain-containing protein [Bacilli bacterium]|nr:FtsQ-type POTRA domain-containing protein [Bacilli bacterium]
MSAKKVKVKVKKRRLKTKNIIITLIILTLLVLTIIDIAKLPVKNIYIQGNNILDDKTIISLADLEGYPPYINTYFTNIKKKLLKNDYIKNVNIKRTLSRKIYLEIEEYNPICIYKDKLVLSSTKSVDNTYNINYIPYVINNIDDIFDKFITKFSQIDKDILLKISHIEYTPNEVDKERFLLYMVDSNYVYITLSKIDKINKYNSIIQKLENKKGIIYLDSGDYVEIKG